jgi:quercetin dioxygenase-like cupin family protein
MIQSFTLARDELLLYVDSARPIGFWLETLEPGQPVRRRDATLWEELFFFDGWISLNGKNFQDSYLCFPPGEMISGVKTTGGKASLLRLAYKASTPLGRKSVIPIETLLSQERVWNEIPLRQQNDPGARVAELFRNDSGKQITSLMECRPGWVLEEHDHSSDVFPFCIRGGGELGLGDQTISLNERQLVRIPSGTRHWFETGRHGALFIIFVFESLMGKDT